MATFLVIGKHSPADCPMHNEKTAKVLADWYKKNPELLAKYGVKVVGGWMVNPEHLTVQVYEAQTAEAMMAYAMDPTVVAQSSWQSIEIKPAITMEEHARIMRQIMQQR